MMRWLFAFLLLLPLSARAEEIVLGLSQDAVAITATFDGSDLLIFGAIKRETPIDTAHPLGVIIAVSGPDSPVTVRRKERRLGLWVNANSVDVDKAPTFYAVASSAPLSDILKDLEDLRYTITIPRAIRSVGAQVIGTEDFTDALIRIRAGEGRYQVLEGRVALEQQTLFSTAITLPSSLTEGDYITRIFLTRNGEVVDEFDTVIPVNKVGMERWLFEMAQEKGFLYGAMSLVIAVAAGWAASAIFSRIRR